MPLRFYNTLSREVEPFAPVDAPNVRMYTCGPTVYHYVHIGNLRTFTFQDLLRRWLRYRGYRLDHVMNITDVEDKIIRGAMHQGKGLREYTEVYEKAFLEDAAALRLEPPERMVRATEHIPEMLDAIGKLAGKGFTYESEGSIYYRIAQFPGYGRLSRLDVDGIRAGARVDVDEYEKADARDFVLWKSRKDGEPYWDGPFGPGRPGWHIECSVMAMKYLGETLDIHTGGVDLAFPHHENEIAQSEALSGKPFVKLWLHAEHLVVEGQKMAKSLGNFYTLRDLTAQGHAPEAVRYLLASAHYRKKLNFTLDGLRAAATALDRLRNFQHRLETARLPDGSNDAMLERTARAAQSFDDAMDDDLNTAEALGAIFEYVRDANTAMDAGEFRSGNAAPARGLLAHFDAIFDVARTSASAAAISDAEVEALVAARADAKKSRDFARADAVRTELLEKGVVLEDTREGVRWKRKS